MDNSSSNVISTSESVSRSLKHRTIHEGPNYNESPKLMLPLLPHPNKSGSTIRAPTKQPPSDPFLYKVLPIIVLFSIGILVVAIHAHLRHGQDKNTCKMTYMNPNYIKLKGPKVIRPLEKYSLWLYKEGQYTELSPNLEGSPVLFIPGHAGSSRQVRSIASVAHTQYRENSDTMHKLDFFTVETNEEMSAFSGRLILEQTEYVNAAISYILSLYQGQKTRPATVSILAHSMGGIIARNIFTLKQFHPGSVDVIFTLATPHQSPPVNLDWELNEVYMYLNSFWRNGTSAERFRNHTTSNVAVISIAGGNNDEMFPSSLTELETLVPFDRGLTVYSTGIPFVWTPTDHRQILWCNQLVKVVARSLSLVRKTRELNAYQKIDLLRSIFTSGYMWTPEESPQNQQTPVDFPSNLIENFESVESAFSNLEPATKRTVKSFPIPSQHRVELELIAIKKTAEDKPPSIIINSCGDRVNRNTTEAECFKINHIHWVPIPLISESKDLASVPEYDARVHHTHLLNSQFGFNSFVVIDVLGGEEVFRAEYTNYSTKYNDSKFGEPFRATLRDLIQGHTQHFLSRRIINTVSVPAIASDILKYNLKFTTNCGDHTPAFWPIIHASSPPSSDEKFLLPVNSSHTFSFYASPINRFSNVLLKIITDGSCQKGNITIHLKVDLYASAGRLIERFGVSWIVFPVGIGIICLAIFGLLKSDEPTFARAFVDHLLMMPSPIAALFGLAVIQSRLDIFLTAIVPRHIFHAEFVRAIETVLQNLVLGINDIYLLPIVPALYIFSGCLALVIWWLLRWIVYVVASFMYLVGFHPSSPPATEVGIERKLLHLVLTILASAIPASFLPHQAMVAVALLIQLVISVRSKIMIWLHPESLASKQMNGYKEMNLALIAYSNILTGPGLLAWLRDVGSGYYIPRGRLTSSNWVDTVSGMMILIFTILGQDRIPKFGRKTFTFLLSIGSIVILFGVRMPYIVLNLEAVVRFLILAASFESHPV